MSTPDKKTVIQLSMNIRCWDELVAYGALDVLEREYGTLIKAQTEPEYHVSLDIDLEQLPGDEGVGLVSAANLTNESQRVGKH